MRTTETRPAPLWKGVFWGALAGVGASLALTALAALLLQKQTIGEGAVGFVNTGIKVLSALVGALAACAVVRRRRVLTGGLAALVYMAAAFVSFGLILGRFRFSPAMLSDFGLTAAAGMLGGAVTGLFSKS